MANTLRPDQAAEALTEIARRRAQVVTLAIVPTWFWWAIAVLMVGFTAAVESRVPLAIGIAIPVFVCGVLVVTGRLVLGVVLRAKPRNDLLRPAGVLAILGFVAVTLAISLPAAFALEAIGARYPATVGNLLAAICLVVGGPLLMRHLRRLMIDDRAGGPR
jgi:hypothetical protein